VDELKKKANVWMDDAYFAAPSQAGQHIQTRPGTVTLVPASPK